MIYWLHDYKLSQWLGGAQLTNEYMIQNSPVEVKSMYPGDFDRSKLEGNLLILNNTGLFKTKDLEWLVETQKYIKYEHDYSFCRHRHAAEHDCSTECRDTLSFYTRMFKKSLLNIFLSPLHRDVYLKYMNLDLRKTHLQPSPINVDRFKYTGPKKNVYLAVGEDSWHKGTDLLRKEYPNLTFVGGDFKVPYEKIHTYYKDAKYFIHKPRWMEPFGRTVAEAYCANCQLITNNNIGFLSYDWDYTDREFVQMQLKASPERFWNKVCSL